MSRARVERRGAGLILRVPELVYSRSMALPKLFQGLDDDDWNRIRAEARSVEVGDEQPISTSVGYIDIGRLQGGLLYVGAMFFDADGGGGLSYRKVMQPQWPKAGRRPGDEAPPVRGPVTVAEAKGAVESFLSHWGLGPYNVTMGKPPNIVRVTNPRDGGDVTYLHTAIHRQGGWTPNRRLHMRADYAPTGNALLVKVTRDGMA